MSADDIVQLTVAVTADNVNGTHTFESSTSSLSRVSLSLSSLSHKRSASHEPEDEPVVRKRMKEDNGSVEPQVSTDVATSSSSSSPQVDAEALLDDLAQELQCGCCAGLVYKPVVVAPCEHFFCGSCCTLWIKNGGTNCPACRGISTIVTPSRNLQAMVDVLLRAAPHRSRSERERIQADEIYPEPRILRLPIPREPSPEPTIPVSSDYVRPCPHCAPHNQFGWNCSTPIVDPNTDIDNAWHLNDGSPPGHGFCGNCEVILALQAPSTSKCDFCQVSFCGINVQGRCSALPLTSQHPHNMSDVADLIQSAEVYECFDGNTVEVEYMLDHMTTQGLTPRHIYREIIAHYQTQPDGFLPLFDQDIFSDLHNVAPGPDPGPSAPRQRICRLCAAEILLAGLRDWWVRERRKGYLEGPMIERADCPEGRDCMRQQDLAHAKEFNHIIVPPIDIDDQARPNMLPPVTSSTIHDLSAGPSSSGSPSPSISREGSTSRNLPSISDLGIQLPPFVIPSTYPRTTSHEDVSIPIFQSLSSAPHVPEPAEDEDDIQEDISFEQSNDSSSQRAVEAHLAASTTLAGYETDQEAGQDGITSDADFQAQYVAVVAQALMRVEETEMDLMNIRKQVKLARNGGPSTLSFAAPDYHVSDSMSVDSEGLVPSSSGAAQSSMV